MLWYLRGQMVDCSPHYVIVDVNGFGLQTYIPASSYFKLPAQGENIILYTYLQVKDDSFALYGFLEFQERDFFEILLGIGGIGPRAALSLIGHLSITQIIEAVVQEQPQAFTTVPGVGTKTAKRIIYELKEKLDKDTIQGYLVDHTSVDSLWIEVSQALTALGYSEVEILRARKELSFAQDATVEILFKQALAQLSQD